MNAHRSYYKRQQRALETALKQDFSGSMNMLNSLTVIICRLECLERRMDRDPKLRENVHNQITEYKRKGYAHPATEEELRNADKQRIWYLPLGTVTNPRKPDKLRLIWDAAAKVGDISLNSVLLKGPDHLTSLPAVLSRFRQYKVGVSADIREMFHQVRIKEVDKHSQRFLWRENPASTPQIWLMDVATFGSTCSPAAAQYIKNRNASEYKEQYPRAVEGIIKNHYVDDSLESYESVEEAVCISKQMSEIHKRAGFQLRGWLSNSKEVLRSLGEERVALEKDICASKKEFESVLGMSWSTQLDSLSISTAVREPIRKLIESAKRPTKRQILKCLMGFFDPLGLWSVFLVHGKVLLQDVWRTGVQWDETVNDTQFQEWKKWTSLFTMMGDIKIPRCYFDNATEAHYDNLQLHIFADASEVAYAALAFFRITNTDGQAECCLVAARTKVAPVKPLSIPRLIRLPS